MAELVSAASHQGADPVASGESFVAGYPLWGGVLPAVRQHTLYEEEEGEATSPSYSIRAPVDRRRFRVPARRSYAARTSVPPGRRTRRLRRRRWMVSACAALK
ncbi:hypothetical protein [Streptosporangium sp. NBC_01755]|uniref:hypothetical protein n=1 Tax=Streptosporangium sp. NBC_01755 TaxID=2975949 RepID=UPI003FA39D71